MTQQGLSVFLISVFFGARDFSAGHVSVRWSLIGQLLADQAICMVALVWRRLPSPPNESGALQRSLSWRHCRRRRSTPVDGAFLFMILALLTPAKSERNHSSTREPVRSQTSHIIQQEKKIRESCWLRASQKPFVVTCNLTLCDHRCLSISTGISSAMAHPYVENVQKQKSDLFEVA